MDDGSLEAMDAEDIETEVISGNHHPVLTLITTEDGIPTSTEVTVLTTALGDVPLMTATLGTLADVPLVTTHPTFVTTTSGGVSTVYANLSSQLQHQGQAVVVRDGNGRIAVMDSDGVRQAIVVTADASQLTSALAQAGVGGGGMQNVVSVNLQVADADDSSELAGGTTMIIQDQGEILSAQTAELEQGPTTVLEELHEIPTQVMDGDEGETAVGEDVIVTESDMHEFVQQQPEAEANVGKDNSLIDVTKTEIIPPVCALNEEENGTVLPSTTVVTDSPEPAAPVVPEEVLCLVCYQAFPNPKRRKEGDEEDCAMRDDKDCSSVSIVPEVLEDNSYGRTLARFFEISRVSMSIVTRRSYKDYEVPICQECNQILVEAERIISELKQLERDLYYVRQQIKDKVITSYKFNKSEENKELTENRKNLPGLGEILEILDRIREDIINDGRPPKIPKLIRGGQAKKPKKAVVIDETQNQEEAQKLDVGNIASVELIEPTTTSNLGEEDTSKTLDTPQSEGVKLETVTAEEQPEIITGDITEESKTEKPAIRTSFGRLIKRPSYMMNDLTDDELSELSESSDDQYEEIEVKPEIMTEGESALLDDEEVDEEDPAWSPGRGMIISEKVGIPTSSSDDSDDLTDDDTDSESPPKVKFRKDTRISRDRKPRKKTSQKKSTARRAGNKQESMNYEVKVIQLDGTELMTINTTGADDNIGLEPDITQKVMDSQAVIMVKNQLFGKRVQCPHCPRTFTDPTRKDVHVKKKHEGVTKPFECDVCRKRFGRQDHLKNHMKRHSRAPKDKSTRHKHITGEKNHTCDFCEQRFRNKSELAVHLRLHTGERPFKCEYCDEAFVSALKREFHIEQMHPDVPPLRCDFCPKGFYRQHRLKIHAVSHTGEKTNICEICGKCFSQAAMLRYHQTTHEELNLKQFKCQECNRVFANPQNLKSHVESQHQKMYRHRCDACGRGYTQMSHLRRHLRTHSGEQPFACSYCPKKFTSGAALKIHVRIHTGERPYWCAQCEKGFRSKTKLGRHLKTLIHSGENKDRMKKETTVTTEIETVDVNAATTTTWTEIVGIITGV